jgi:hypothetical protein
MLHEANRSRLAEQPGDAKGKPVENPWLGRVQTAAGTRLDLVRSATGAWLDAQHLTPRKVSQSTTKMLPACIDGVMTDKMLDVAALDGFVPLVAVNADTLIGPHTAPPPGALFIRRSRPGSPGPVDVATRPAKDDVEAAWTSLRAQLPGIDSGYVSGLVTAALQAQRADGPPPVAVATGDTGTAKSTTQALVGSMIGGGAVGVAFGRDADATRRSIGLALEWSGASLLFVDEIARVPELYEKVSVVLELGSAIRFAAKYHNERTVPFTAPFSILGSTMPPTIVASPELARRAVGWRLTQPATGVEAARRPCPRSATRTPSTPARHRDGRPLVARARPRSQLRLARALLEGLRCGRAT